LGRRRKGIPGLTWSWKRAIGLSALKGRISRKIGIPLTREGRQRKVGRLLGCCVPLLLLGGTVGSVLGGGGTRFAEPIFDPGAPAGIEETIVAPGRDWQDEPIESDRPSLGGTRRVSAEGGR